MVMPAAKLEGERFGRLIVLRRSGSIGRNSAWECLCNCGSTVRIVSYALKRGQTSSCGCLQKELAYENNITHGHASGTNKPVSSTYHSWSAMKSRCTNPNATGYDRYGGRGITVCDRWINSFENFLSDMGSRPPEKTIDRKDNDGNYEPNNCKRATRQEQQSNRGYCHV